MWITSVISALQKHKVKYAVAGGYAVALHGTARPTSDLDLIADLSLPNLLKIESALNELGYKPKSPFSAEDIARYRRELVKKRKIVEWPFVNHDNRKIDILIHRDLAQVRTEPVRLQGDDIPVIAPIELSLTPSFEVKRYLRTDPESAVRFIEDIYSSKWAKDAPTKLISIRVPENILSSFKAVTKANGKKYQSLIVELMREYLRREIQ